MKKINYFILFSIVITIPSSIVCMYKLIKIKNNNDNQLNKKLTSKITPSISLNKIIPYLEIKEKSKDKKTGIAFLKTVKESGSLKNFNPSIPQKFTHKLILDIDINNHFFPLKGESTYTFNTTAQKLIYLCSKNEEIKNYCKQQFLLHKNVYNKATFQTSTKKIEIDGKNLLNSEEIAKLNKDMNIVLRTLKSAIKIGKLIVAIQNYDAKSLNFDENEKLIIIDSSTKNILYTTKKPGNINPNTICPLSENEFVYIFNKNNKNTLLKVSKQNSNISTETLNILNERILELKKTNNGNLIASVVLKTNETFIKRHKISEKIIPFKSLQKLSLKDLILCNYLFDNPNIDLFLSKNKPFKDILDNNETLKTSFEKIKEYNKSFCITM